MFTGLIDHCGTIAEITSTAVGKQLKIACQFADLQRGESIAIDGACLTITEHGLGFFCCDISPETLLHTSFSNIQVGDLVNLERALLLTSRLGGHFVLGHVDQTCVLTAKMPHAEYMVYRFAGLVEGAKAFCVKKGSICINGVSLTINTVEEDNVEVMLIPETLLKTNLKQLQLGDKVNVEYDYLAKLVQHSTK